MTQARTAACNTLFRRGDIASGAHLSRINVVDEENYNVKKLCIQASSGNRCDHDPKNIKNYGQPSHYKRRFHVIGETMSRIKNGLMDRFAYPMLNGLMFHVEHGRKKKSERREAELHIILPYIIDHVNLNTMQLGYFRNFSFVNLDYSHISKVTGLGYSRIKRAMLSLQASGIVTVKTILTTLENGAIRTKKVIISVTEKIFEMMGTLEELRKDQERARKNRVNEEKKIIWKSTPPAKVAAPSYVKDALKGIADIFKKSPSNRANVSQKPAKTVSQDKQVLSIASDLMKSGQFSSSRDAIVHACKLLNKPPPE